MAIANNIITAGKGMKMAPTAKLDDGLIDLLLITTASTLDMMTIFRKVYDGSHTSTSTHHRTTHPHDTPHDARRKRTRHTHTHAHTHDTRHALKECETQQNCRTSGTSR